MPSSTCPSPAAKAVYHHGDLRRGLVDAATAILSETQRWDFSLREVARRAGVSHNAPYAHFSDKRALLAAVGVAGYDMLRRRMEAAASDTRDAGEALAAIGNVYVGFGLENPAYYRLMFGQELRSVGGQPADLLAAAAASRAVLRDVVCRGARDGTFDVDADDPLATVTAVVACWSMVHGFTLLAIDGLAQLETASDVRELAALVGARLQRGLVKN